MQTVQVMAALALALLLAACAGQANAPANAPVDDPLETMNRFFFALNQRVDRHAALPLATAYHRTVPQPVRSTLHNILDNLGGPMTVVNDLLQTQFTNAGIAAGRFLVNTTVGVVGAFDVATDWGMPTHNRDFGETLGTYGVPPGPFLVLPLRGLTDVRDFAGNYLDGYATPLHYVRYNGNQYVGLMSATVGSLDARSANIGVYRDIERTSVDYYAAMRDRYLERRERLVEDRTVLPVKLPDF